VFDYRLVEASDFKAVFTGAYVQAAEYSDGSVNLADGFELHDLSLPLSPLD
jgi:hypothetical protein